MGRETQAASYPDGFSGAERQPSVAPMEGSVVIVRDSVVTFSTMNYVPVPIALLPIGKPLPISLWTPDGMLLLKKGSPIESQAHRDRLADHKASTTEVEAQAWQRAHDRMVNTLVMRGMPQEEAEHLPLPEVILERDYAVIEPLGGSWIDVQEMLRDVLYRSRQDFTPLQRLVSLEHRVRELLTADPDDSLFCLFQALADSSLGYCAKHALLCATICELAGQKLGLNKIQREALMTAALTMNIGMSREQDILAAQDHEATPDQRKLIKEHPILSHDILQESGMADDDVLDIVRWHHEPESPQGQSRNLLLRRLLSMTDVFVAKMAARRTREARSPLESARSIYQQNGKNEEVNISGALAAATGFFPPGTYVRLASGEIAVTILRSARANTPWVMPIIDKHGLPMSSYQTLDTSKPGNGIAAPQAFGKIKIKLDLERVRRARTQIRA